MKTIIRTFTTCLLYVCCVTNQAQMPNDPFHPMLQDGKKWKTEDVGEWKWKTEEVEDWQPTREYYHYIEGDTLIGGKQWKKVYSNIQGGDYEYFAAITEEEGKVYAIASGKDRVRLLYDFSLQVGDRVGCNSESYRVFDYLVESDEEWLLQSMELKSIDTIKVRGQELRRFIFESYYVDKTATRSTSFSYPSLVWVEGIGSEGGLFASWSKATLETRVSCYVDDELVFSADDFHITNEPNDTDSRYFPTGTTWKEVIAEPGMPLDTLNGAVEYEIGADTTINDQIYKKVLKNGVVQDVFLRVQDGKVMLTADDFAEELLLYDFKWGSNDMLYMELLHDNEGELTKEVISYKTADAYATTVDGKTFSCIQDNSGVVVRDIGRVLDCNRNGCVLGYRQPEPVLPGLQAFKLLWMRRGGEEVFRSDNADDFTNTSLSVTATQTEAKPSATYLLSGQKISADTPSKGIRIIRMSDGTVKKVYSK